MRCVRNPSLPPPPSRCPPFNCCDSHISPRTHHPSFLNNIEPSQNAAFLLHRWGVRYVVTENVHHHDRPRRRAWEEARAAAERGEQVEIPNFDPNSYLDGAIMRVFSSGRFDVFRVT